MSKDEIKENISTYRAYSLLVLTSIFGIFGYAAVNISKLENAQIFIGLFFLVVLSVIFIILSKKYNKSIQNLRNFK